MDGSRFDAWTRRRFGMAAGGLAGSLLALTGWEDAEATNKKNKKKCKKLGQSCSPGGKRKCCHRRLCGFPITDAQQNHCCKPGGQSCTTETAHECCTGLCELGECFCKSQGQVCSSHAQCCSKLCEPDNECA